MIRRTLIGSTKEIEQTRNHSFNLDTVLLAKFLKLSKKTKNVLDVGTGNGALLIYVSEMVDCKLIGVEIQEERYGLAVNNIKLNQLENRTELVLGDYLETDFKNLDCIISNPPFFKTNDENHLSDDVSQQIARHELTLSLDKLLVQVGKQLKFGGYFYMVHRADRFSEIVEQLNENHLTVKRVKFVHPYIDKPANHVLIQCIKHGKDSMIVEAPLIVYKDKHIYSESFESFIGGKINVT